MIGTIGGQVLYIDATWCYKYFYMYRATLWKIIVCKHMIMAADSVFKG